MKEYRWGRFAERGLLGMASARALCRQAQARRALAAERPLWKTLAALDKTGRLWAERGGSRRRRARALLVASGAFSAPMIERTLDIIPALLDRRALAARLRAELGRADALERWSIEPAADFAVRAAPLGAVLTVAAGNIFLGCIDSVLMGLLTNNVVLLKTSAADREFPLLFAESLRAADPEGSVARTLAVVSWKSGDAAVEGVFKASLQGIAVWGAEEALRAYRKDLGLGCRLLEFGPKLSFAVVSRRGLKRWGTREAARRAAVDIARWDQAACASPQALFIQGPERPFLAALASELQKISRLLPKGPIRPEEAVVSLEARHRALAAELLGQGEILASPRGQDWTVAFRKRPGLRTSPLGRFIQISPYRDLEQLAALVSPASAHLQSAGLLVAPAQTGDYARTLSLLGVTRCAELGGMLSAEAGEPHDGRRPLAELVRWVSAPQSVLSMPEESAARSLLDQARAESPFYRRRLKRLGRDAGLSRVPPLTKRDLYANTPPKSKALLTWEGTGLVFASGGSTGKPKFSLFTQDEFDETCRWLALGLRRSGLKEGDVVANLFMAGNLWSSFTAISRALRQLPVTELPIGGNASPQDALEALRVFHATAVVGLPATLLDIARLAREKKVRGLSVRKVFYAGEGLSPAAAEELRRSLGASLIRSAGYASVDAGLIGYQCRDCGPGEHHAAGLQHMEIVDGEILATNLVRRWMPIIRYRTGDLGRWLAPCRCGDPAPRFLLRGRRDDRLNVGGAHFDLEDASRAVGDVKGLSPLHQAVISIKGNRDCLMIRVERRGRDARRDGALAAALGRALLARSLELRDCVARGWLAPPAVEVLAPGGLPRNPRTGKIRAVADLRK
ncbi:MAG TPA: hypothetical protein DCZ01_12940 [Elusimicrobia bacterium]|nr:MAG: hypothetical protein A2X37_04355 [Elusimicrobia bacterium GWA2_66_18]OGR73305.1 MAG: hypothetical protein A2X40_03705 [Elusimicrobia bacterium GWC2_65_9]HAZ09392.1 hypothetical protein [Elusimicrobiota bacterium]